MTAGPNYPKSAVTSFLLTSLGKEFKRQRGHSMERIFPSMPVPSHMEATTDGRIFCVLPEIFLACINKHIYLFSPLSFFHPWKYTRHIAPFYFYLIDFGLHCTSTPEQPLSPACVRK